MSGGGSNSPLKVTPPSIISFPPTPPATEQKVVHNHLKVLDLFRRGQEYQLKRPWTTIKLQPGDYEKAIEELNSEDNYDLKRFVDAKLRYDSFTHL